MLIITDQQRQVQHWSTYWFEEYLMPTMKRLQRHGVTFTNNYTAASLCSPSRASFLTGVYPSVHGVKHTQPKPPLRPWWEITNIFKLAEDAGYEVAYKGKMHLFTSQSNPSGCNFTSYDIDWAAKNYCFKRWNPPDCALEPSPDVWIPGGWPNNDRRFVRGVPHRPNRMTPAVDGGEPILEYLEHYKQKYKDKPDKDKKPFLLVCSFGNPHDISIWPHQEEWGYECTAYKELREINLPSNYTDDLKEKPIAQREFQKLTDITNPCQSKQDRIEYCRFYGHLHTVVDRHIRAVLDKLDETGLTDDTIIFRFADHGEQCWSHQMIQKALNSYQETINVPLIISNPKLFPKGTTTSSFSSLIDLVPTIAELTGVASPEKLEAHRIRGKSLVPIMKDPNNSVRENIMFYTEDCESIFNQYLGTPENLYEIMPGKIRSIRYANWMYAVYFTDNCTLLQYEMYDLDQDPGQLTNLAWGSRNSEHHNRKWMMRLHEMLTDELDIYDARPDGWPESPWCPGGLGS
jgi:arylsulfatase A-like enzyme